MENGWKMTPPTAVYGRWGVVLSFLFLRITARPFGWTRDLLGSRLLALLWRSLRNRLFTGRRCYALWLGRSGSRLRCAIDSLLRLRNRSLLRFRNSLLLLWNCPLLRRLRLWPRGGLGLPLRWGLFLDVRPLARRVCPVSTALLP